MKLPNSAHEAHPSVIRQIAPDFTLLDVWALPVEGDAEEFGAALEVLTGLDPARAASAPTRLLFAVRFRLGELLRWDDAEPRPIPGCQETTLADRLPAELRGTGRQPALAGGLQKAARGFRPLYRTANEYAAELSNATVHGVLHLGWVEKESGRYGAQMGVYVKPRGLLGQAYLQLIAPFRHLIVYPALTRSIERKWSRRRPSTASSG